MREIEIAHASERASKRARAADKQNPHSAVADKLDDVGFVQAVVQDVIARQLHATSQNSAMPRITIDQSAVYLTGFSNGGFLASVLARQSTLFRKVFSLI